MDSPINPWRPLFFLLGTSLVLGALAMAFPQGKVPGTNIKIPSIYGWLSDKGSESSSADSLLNGPMASSDTELTLEALGTKNGKAWASLSKEERLQFEASDTTGLKPLVQRLRSIQSKGGRLRVLHFGDSQIEGDRMTSLFREYFQKRFGGEGPSLQPIFPFVPSFSIQHTASDQWKRYTHFGSTTWRVKSKKYGVMGLFARFTSSESALGTDTVKAWVQFKPSSVAFSRAKTFSRIEWTYGNLRAPLRLVVKFNDTVYETRTLKPIEGITSIEWRVTSTPRKVRLEFEGIDSPDAYGISFDGTAGISVDNIAMRGAAGVTFTSMDQVHFAEALQREPIGLILLQFGGNAMPHVKDSAAIARYGQSIALQIRRFKKWAPEAQIVLIGPSDMCIKQELEYVTYPNLEQIRNALKSAAFKERVAFFDTYAFMGGEGSMKRWVEDAQPPLAGPDYIHFTPRGARKAGEGMLKAIEAQLQKDGIGEKIP